MIEISRKLYYATEAVLYIAYNSANERISSKAIATTHQLPPRYLEQIMQKLVKAKILKGMRGPNGGYLLAREKRRISVNDIAQALEEEENFTPSTLLGKKILLPFITLLQDNVREKMQNTTIADLYEKAVSHRIPKADNQHTDFTI